MLTMFLTCLKKVMQNIHKTYFWDLLSCVTKLVKGNLLHFLNSSQGSLSPMMHVLEGTGAAGQQAEPCTTAERNLTPACD